MNERGIHERGRARGSEHDAARDRRPTRCVSPSLNAPDAGIRATRYRTVCLELAPKLNEDLGSWTGGGSDLFDHLMGIPECNAQYGTWSDFLIGENGWHQAQFNNEVNFGWGDAVGPLYDARLTIVCYGSTLQGPVVDPLWDLAALRCQNACAENFPNNEPRFSPLKGYYETAASNYQIPDFDPHENACASCPGN